MTRLSPHRSEAWPDSTDDSDGPNPPDRRDVARGLPACLRGAAGLLDAVLARAGALRAPGFSDARPRLEASRVA